MTTPTPGDVTSQMRQALAVSDPALDTTIGTPTRKILDAVGEAISEAYIDKNLLDYQYDIDAKVGADLDGFVSLFGFARLPAKRAVGSVTFGRATPAPEDQIIRAGTQLATLTTPVIYAQTNVPAIMFKGTTEITVPVEASEPGSFGNVPSGGLAVMVMPDGDGIVGVSNQLPLSGGTNVESDVQLRARFKTTVFRSLAGTEQQFLGTALEHPAVTHANVIGASKRFREQVQVANGKVISTVQDAKYIFPNTSFLGIDIDGGDILAPNIHYTFDTSVIPPEVRTIGAGLQEAGIYTLDFEYAPVASRNQPTKGITNRVDLYVNGNKSEVAAQSLIFTSAFGTTFSTDTADPLFRGNFIRDTRAIPAAGNRFLPLAFGPLLDIPEVITVGTKIYARDTHYWLVSENTSDGYSFSSQAGIEWDTPSLPALNSVAPIDYVYNRVPYEVEQSVRLWRLVTTDVRVHQAHTTPLRINLAIMYAPTASRAVVDLGINRTIEQYLAQTGFNSVVQASDILGVVHNVAGVDSVRFLTATESPLYYAIQRVNSNLQVVETFQRNGRVQDVLFGDAELPTLAKIFLSPRAQNTFGSGA